MEQVGKESTKQEAKQIKEVAAAVSIEENDKCSVQEKPTIKDTDIDADVENEKGDHKKSGLKVALDRVYREKSSSHIQIPKELSSHLLNLSSANISEQLKKSCSNIVAHMDQELSKEFLLKKLEELLKQEKKQVSEDLKRRKEQLRETKANHAKEMQVLADKQKCQIQNLQQNYSKKLSKLESRFLDDMENLKKDIELLENEKENMKAPNLIINDCLSVSSRAPSGMGKKQTLSEIESELECCKCGFICRPPSKIYQCPEGDIFCESCKQLEVSVTHWSRNKVLEKIASKYY